MLHLEKYLDHKTHVIWDWNGTLLNDLELCVAVVSAMRESEGLSPLRHEEYRQLFRMPIRDYYIALGFDASDATFERIVKDFIQRYEAGIAQCDLFQDARTLLLRLQASGKKLAILSAARETDLHALTRHFGIDHLFDHIYGLSDAYAASKIERGRKLLARWNAPKEATILVGDMDHDAHVADALGIDVLLLADGHQNYDRLVACHPNTLRSRFEPVAPLAT